VQGTHSKVPRGSEQRDPRGKIHYRALSQKSGRFLNQEQQTRTSIQAVKPVTKLNLRCTPGIEPSGKARVPTILVVDDDRLIRQMVSMVLAQEGFRVLTAESGAQAIEIWAATHGEIDLLITDVRMPGMDGRALANRILAERPDLPVLLMSGFCDSDDDGACGRFPLLAKPFPLTSLVTSVRDLLEMKAQGAMAQSVT
jgi:CheY-like chemotaxis protein